MHIIILQRSRDSFSLLNTNTDRVNKIGHRPHNSILLLNISISFFSANWEAVPFEYLLPYYSIMATMKIVDHQWTVFLTFQPRVYHPRLLCFLCVLSKWIGNLHCHGSYISVSCLFISVARIDVCQNVLPVITKSAENTCLRRAYSRGLVSAEYCGSIQHEVSVCK